MCQSQHPNASQHPLVFLLLILQNGVALPANENRHFATSELSKLQHVDNRGGCAGGRGQGI